jgi:hypothetical protein
VGENNIQLWELATNRVRRKWTGHEESAIRALAYSPDGRFLASGSADTTVLIWDMSLSDRAAAVVSPQRWEPASLWQALAEDDGPRAFAAIGGLAAAPEKSVPWIQQHLPPAAPIDPKRIEELIGQLEDNRFRVRQQATAELLRIGERVVPAIDRVLAGNPVLESRLRLQAVRARVTGLVLKAGRLQAYRAMEVLERIGTPEARQVLQALAGGSPGALATTQAQETLARLQK